MLHFFPPHSAYFRSVMRNCSTLYENYKNEHKIGGQCRATRHLLPNLDVIGHVLHTSLSSNEPPRIPDRFNIGSLGSSGQMRVIMLFPRNVDGPELMQADLGAADDAAEMILLVLLPSADAAPTNSDEDVP